MGCGPWRFLHIGQTSKHGPENGPCRVSGSESDALRLMMQPGFRVRRSSGLIHKVEMPQPGIIFTTTSTDFTLLQLDRQLD